MSDKAIGKRIKQIRINRGMTQTMFGSLLGISHSHVSNIENGKENPSNTLILMICSHFNIEKEWILHGEGEMNIIEIDTKSKDEDERLEELLDLYRKLFNATYSVVKKEQYNQIIASILSTLVSDSYYYQADLEESSKLEFLSCFVEIVHGISTLTYKTRSILQDNANDNIYKKIYDINQVYNKKTVIINENIRSLISNLCKEKDIEF